MELQPAVYQVVKLGESSPSRLTWKILKLQCIAKYAWDEIGPGSCSDLNIQLRVRSVEKRKEERA